MGLQSIHDHKQSSQSHTGTGSRWSARLGAVTIALAISAVVLWQTAYWVGQFARDDIRDRKEHVLNLVVENLRGELAKFQYQPSLLARSPVFQVALQPDPAQAGLAAVNRELERINFLSGALNTYLLNKQGIAVAASNWATAQSSIGKSFRTQPYFEAALQGRLGRHFALVEPGASEDLAYFFAYPVRRGNRIDGAVVIKLRMERLAERWLAPDHETLVIDQDGVVFMSSRSEWRFKTFPPFAADGQRGVGNSDKYGDRPLSSIPVEWDDTRGIVQIGTLRRAGASKSVLSSVSTPYLVQRTNLNAAGWQVLILARLDEVERRQNVALVVAAFMLVILMLLAAYTNQRRLRFQERIALQGAAQAGLEKEVQQRTVDLTEANAQLRIEIGERRRAEAVLRKTQDELVQATKLAALGQMSAGLSHELNQPLSAIRSYSDNSRAFLQRGDAAAARSNLESISELTDRMDRIIRNLRTYARGEDVTKGPISARRALEEALALLDGRFRAENITRHADLPDDELMVNGGQVRLQQVFVNIMSNAIDAMKGCDEKRLEIKALVGDADIAVSVRDTGPGIPESHLDNIFDPFFSTKEVGEGMGLGLSITYGIVSQFDGRIEARNHPDGGAVFFVFLKRRLQSRDAAE